MPERTCRGDQWHAAHDQPGIRDKKTQAMRKYFQEHPDAHRGTNNPRAKLNEEKVREIRKRYAAGESSLKLAAAFSVSKPVILSVIHRRSWSHVK
jgi:hypothetical protein